MNELSRIYEVQIRRPDELSGVVERVHASRQFLVLRYADGRFAVFKAMEDFVCLSNMSIRLCDWDLSVPELVKCGLLDVDLALELLAVGSS